jgi:hypothetical protein
MSRSKTSLIALACIGLWFVLAPRPTRANFVPVLTVDVTQPFTSPEDNFEEVLQGNLVNRLTGPFLNGFSTPNSVSVHFNAPTNTTIVQFGGPAIAQNPNTRYTFGVALNNITSGGTTNPNLIDEYWTMGQTVEGHIPQQDISVKYSSTLQTATVTISNDPDTFSLFNVGYLVTNSSFALSSLNRTTLPPGAFTASGVPNGTVLTPGTNTSFTISGVHTGQYVTVFADAKFSGTSSGNPYTDTSGRWFELQATPEPASWALMLVGVAGVAGWRCTRNFKRRAWAA